MIKLLLKFLLCDRHCAKCFRQIISFSLQTILQSRYYYPFLFFSDEKLRHREMKSPSHTTFKWQSYSKVSGFTTLVYPHSGMNDIHITVNALWIFKRIFLQIKHVKLDYKSKRLRHIHIVIQKKLTGKREEEKRKEYLFFHLSQQKRYCLIMHQKSCI